MDDPAYPAQKQRDANNAKILRDALFVSKVVSLRSLPLDEKALPRPLFTRKTINETIKGGDVPRDGQPALTTVLTGVVPLNK
jgi:hypothetical protein